MKMIIHKMNGETKKALFYKELFNSFFQLNDIYIGYINERTGLLRSSIRQLMEEETQLSAKDARDLGIVHEIMR